MKPTSAAREKLLPPLPKNDSCAVAPRYATRARRKPTSKPIAPPTAKFELRSYVHVNPPQPVVLVVDPNGKETAPSSPIMNALRGPSTRRGRTHRAAYGSYGAYAPFGY